MVSIMSVPGPIGIFDSGFGGLTIFKRIRELLPAYDFVYLGDNARTPYGNRSFETVCKFTIEAIDYLLRHGCPLIVIACNTASAKALRNIQQQYLPVRFPDRRVLGVIRPTVEAVGSQGDLCTVALWATPGTVSSGSFTLEIAKYAPRVRLVQQACPMLVPLVEAGELDGEGLDHFILKYWSLTAGQNDHIDTLLLACTHYPLIFPRIRALLPKMLRILSQDDLVAPSLAGYLRRHPEMESRLSRGGDCLYLTTDQCQHFDHLAEIFMGHPVSSRKVELS